MSSNSKGPGVRRFWQQRANGEYVDVRHIVQEHPDEALALADAIREAAAQDNSQARERMWLAHAQELARSGEGVTLGSLLRTSRQDVGLTTTALSTRVKERGVTLHPTAIDQLEADRVRVANVRTPGLWATLTEILGIDRHRLVATIRVALVGPRTEQRFTRMERGATSANRESFLRSRPATDQEDDVTNYVDWVRAELGLPTSPTDAVQ